MEHTSIELVIYSMLFASNSADINLMEIISHTSLYELEVPTTRPQHRMPLV